MEALDELLEEFLSTPSARRATLTNDSSSDVINDFYPRPPRGGRLTWDQGTGEVLVISIHALREEGDLERDARTGTRYKISIHALREEGDAQTANNLQGAQ